MFFCREFVCGAVIVPTGASYAALSRKEVTVDRRKLCEDPLEPYIYHFEDKIGIPCAICSEQLSNELVQQFKEKKEVYTTVIPTCQNIACGKEIITEGPIDGWICKGINKAKQLKQMG